MWTALIFIRTEFIIHIFSQLVFIHDIIYILFCSRNLARSRIHTAEEFWTILCIKNIEIYIVIQSGAIRVRSSLSSE